MTLGSHKAATSWLPPYGSSKSCRQIRAGERAKDNLQADGENAQSRACAGEACKEAVHNKDQKIKKIKIISELISVSSLSRADHASIMDCSSGHMDCSSGHVCPWDSKIQDYCRSRRPGGIWPRALMMYAIMGSHCVSVCRAAFR